MCLNVRHDPISANSVDRLKTLFDTSQTEGNIRAKKQTFQHLRQVESDEVAKDIYTRHERPLMKGEKTRGEREISSVYLADFYIS